MTGYIVSLKIETVLQIECKDLPDEAAARAYAVQYARRSYPSEDIRITAIVNSNKFNGEQS